MTRRWRPSLAFVLGGALAGTLALSFAGLVALRYLGPVIGFRHAAILLAIAITLATALVGWLLVRLLLRPILALKAYADAQERGLAPSPPQHFGTRELHATARGVIAMAEALRDREATVRAFTDHVTHELRTPVSAIQAATELLEDSAALSPSDAALLSRIDGARAQIAGQLAGLRDIARARETRYLGQSCLAEVLVDLQQGRPTLHLTVKGETRSLPIGAKGLSIVLGHMLRNAAEHGATSVNLRVEGDTEGTFLTVADDGTGVSGGNAARIFDPFFTTRRDDGGTGMGLAVVRNLLHAHAADIGLMPSDTGACFRIQFV